MPSDLQIPNQPDKTIKTKGLSFCNYLKSELRRGYLLENDEERYAARREKVYTFFKIPLEIERFLFYGFLQSADSFLFVMTFLPIRFTLALYCLVTRPLKKFIGYSRNVTRLMKPAEIIDLLKGALLILCCYVISYIDTSVFYHIIKTQSTIKLYFFFNMLEIADRLMSAFGQDTLDALFWTATEPRDRKREHFGIIFHFMVASFYVAMHSAIVLLQALTLNVAINSDNKGLLTIVISNNFVELKGAVFKKFDRNNLLQISCSDVRERFHICVLLFVVVIQTMKEYAWKSERLWILLPDCLLILGTEVLVDWIKHAFITRFNDIPVDAYKDYSLLIASDLITCKQKYAFSDHSDLVARRMAFIPLPLGVVIFRILNQSIKITNAAGVLLFVLAFLCLLSFRVFNGIVILGMACDRINSAEIQRSRNSSECVDRTATKTGLQVYSTPSRDRKRTPSSKGTDLVCLEETSNSFTVNESKDSKDSTNVTGGGRSFCENVSSNNLQETSNSLAEEECPSLTFLGESQSGLFANSMVNLSSVGLNKGVSDHDQTATQITQDISPDISLEKAFEGSVAFNGTDIEEVTESKVSPFTFDDNSKVHRRKEESKISATSLSFTSTQSCPCFTEIQYQKDKNAESMEYSEDGKILDKDTSKTS
ncbi:UNVERIFIED_CONTAM: hypothetical protein RMT77_005608 [Armadillidium vulgare]